MSLLFINHYTAKAIKQFPHLFPPVLDNRPMTIRFYDVEIEEMREATQEDWDRLRDSLIKLQRYIEKLEGSHAVTMGTLEAPAPPDAPFAVAPAESNTPR
jgi:hypothetical protein